MAFIGDASNTVDIGYNLIVKVYNEKVKVGRRIGLVLRFREHHIIHTEEEVVEKNKWRFFNVAAKFITEITAPLKENAIVI